MLTLERRFQSVMVEEPSTEQAVEILRGLRTRYEQHHGMLITEEAMEAAVRYSVRYLPERYLPDKAIDLMDEACSVARLLASHSKQEQMLQRQLEQAAREEETAVCSGDFGAAAKARERYRALQAPVRPALTAGDVARVVAERTGVDVGQMTRGESETMLRLEAELHRRVCGQDEAVRAVANAIKRSRVGLADPKRPIGTFLFAGGTGVGKTELGQRRLPPPSSAKRTRWCGSICRSIWKSIRYPN
jgi:ATP-dependent Clp protease ATP-binding subunit ClpC